VWVGGSFLLISYLDLCKLLVAYHQGTYITSQNRLYSNYDNIDAHMQWSISAPTLNLVFKEISGDLRD
jgi:hypothetical protein